MVPVLETERLLLRPLEMDDVDQVQVLFPHWEIVQYLHAIVPWPYPKDGALTHMRDVTLPAMERGEEWHWSLFVKTAPQELIGRICLARGENNRGFWLGRVWQGQGLMTEAVIAVTDYWFNVLEMPVLRVPKAVANTASRRISEKMGMRVVAKKASAYVCGVMPTEVWEITAEEWRVWRDSSREGNQ